MVRPITSSSVGNDESRVANAASRSRVPVLKTVTNAKVLQYRALRLAAWALTIGPTPLW
jgi:hypothetical protein